MIRKELESDPGSLQMVLPGSFHQSIDPITTNSAPIWFLPDRNGFATASIEEFFHHKTERLVLKTSAIAGFGGMQPVAQSAASTNCDHVFEDIAVHREGHLIDTPLGVFGIAICRDALANTRLQGLYQLAVDHLFIISMDAGRGWFSEFAERVARGGPTATYYVNATQAATGPGDPVAASWRTPEKIGSGTISARLEATIKPDGAVFELNSKGFVCWTLPMSAADVTK
jgi:hypothetical protein